ncbi:thioredoxin [Hippoglossus stenolepis]|uniref:thioredoxin n=1 Tax=Hippoglossus stenolepis TaxID=195615 RepID=UPI00159C9B19|nr:thioredoxin [Hippoglossus stenolepis]
MVHEVTGLEDFHKQLKDAGDKLVVVDFTATWCGPCKQISPVFVKMAADNPGVVFLKVDVDDAEEVSALCEIKCMPTFIFYRTGKKVDELSGANSEKLSEMLKKHM